MNNNTTALTYTLRGLQLIGWRDMQHVLGYLFVDRQLKQGTPVAINAERILAIEDDAEVRELVDAIESKYVDSISVVRPVRKKYPQAQVSRVVGADFWEELMARVGKGGTPVFLVGGKPEVLAQTEAKLRSRWNMSIVGSQDGYFKPKQRQALFEYIHANGAQIAIAAMRSPRQEIIMRDCRLVYPDALYIGVGGTHDVLTDCIERALRVWQTLGLEWLYRLFSQSNRTKRQFHLLRCLRWHCIDNLWFSSLYEATEWLLRRLSVLLLHKALEFLMLYLPFLLNYENICNTRCTHDDNRQHRKIRKHNTRIYGR